MTACSSISLFSRGVDGLGITVSNESFQDETIRKKLASLSIPYVMIDRMYPDLNCSKVYFDNESGAYMAIEKLVKSGHKKIACIGISSASKTGASRVAGYRKAMQQFQLEVREDLYSRWKLSLSGWIYLCKAADEDGCYRCLYL
mgnify:CR=1 FL=1